MTSSKKPKATQLRVLSPCDEKWESMTPQGPGRYCDRCEHTVLDLSRATRREAQALLDKHADLNCIQMIVDEDGLPVYRSGSLRVVRRMAMSFGLLAACGAQDSPQQHVLGEMQQVDTPPAGQTVTGEKAPHTTQPTTVEPATTTTHEVGNPDACAQSTAEASPTTKPVASQRRTRKVRGRRAPHKPRNTASHDADPLGNL